MKCVPSLWWERTWDYSKKPETKQVRTEQRLMAPHEGRELGKAGAQVTVDLFPILLETRGQENW